MSDSVCKKCGTLIVWIKTKSGKAMPCDMGMVTIITDEGDVVRGRESHFSSCPFADDFRKK